MDILDIVKEIRTFDFSSYLEKSREHFVGRKWMYRDLEDKVTKTNSSGIILVGEPGWGKTAFLSNTICSSTSSHVIFNNILAYHFCIYNEPLKHHPGYFTKNIVSMLINRLPEYGRILTNDSLAMRKLDSCVQDPLECFEMVVVKPLQKVSDIPIKRHFIIVDAIDECQENYASHISLLQLMSAKVSDLPDWIKFIFSSRNFTGLNRLKRRFEMIEIKSHEAKNVQDIENYLYLELYRKHLIGRILEICRGNFLVAKELQSYVMEQSSDSLISFPSSLCEIYQAHVERLTNQRDGGRSKNIQQILEILVASNETLSVQAIHEILLKSNLSAEYDDIVIPLKQLSNYLVYDKNGSAKLYHQSFADCLERGEMETMVRKKRGHTLLATHYCSRLATNLKMKTSVADFHSLFLLCLRQLIFAENGSQKSILKEILSIPHSLLNATDEFNNNQTILHKAIFEAESDQILSVLAEIGCFQDVDVQDAAGKTPSFIAAAVGKAQLLSTLINMGSNINIISFPPPQSRRVHGN